MDYLGDLFLFLVEAGLSENSLDAAYRFSTEPPLLGTSHRQLTLERPVSSCHTACLEVSAEQWGPWFGLVVLSTMSVAYQRLSEFKVTAESTKGWSTSMWLNHLRSNGRADIQWC